MNRTTEEMDRIESMLDSAILNPNREALTLKVPFEFTDKIDIEEIGGYGGDWLVVDAARVSSRHSPGSGPREVTEKSEIGLIKSLAKNRHTAPFQHGGLTFFVAAPIFVFREWRTHRVAMVQTTDDFAYSEASARYRLLQPKFWIPSTDRPMLKRPDHKAMKPVYDPVDENAHATITNILKMSYQHSWFWYQTLLNQDVAPEVARAVLPVGTYSAMYVSANPKSLMHFLSLRTHESPPTALFESFPQYEIEVAARAAEEVLRKGWPVTYQAFQDAGRFVG